MAGQFRAMIPLAGTGLEVVEAVEVVVVEEGIVLVVGLVDKIVVEELTDEEMSAVAGTLLFFLDCVPPTAPPTTAPTTRITTTKTSNARIPLSPHQRFC